MAAARTIPARRPYASVYTRPRSSRSTTRVPGRRARTVRAITRVSAGLVTSSARSVASPSGSARIARASASSQRITSAT